MATLPSEFKDLANELIGPTGEFAAFRKPCQFSKSGEFNFESQSAQAVAFTVQMVESGIVENQSQNKAIAQNEIELIGILDEFSELPTIGTTRFIYSGLAYTLLSVEIDPAQAAVTIKGVI